ncbi:MAG TPA: histidinol-phosphate transaminase [Pseudogracilibacillus sp.]|nr:histidinol-phosphate transaminase [Pseudogracilibacillus sp.]
MSRLWSKMARRATPYIPGEQVNETNIIKLNTNENPYPPAPGVLEAIKQTADEQLRLYPSPTMDSLREEIAQFYNVTKEEVFIGNGSDEVLAFSFMGFFDPEKPIRFPKITYSFYPVYANVFQIDYEEIPLQEDFTIDVEALFDSEGGVIFPNPNAPTSLYLPLEEIERILERNKDQVVIVDEAYIDFAPESAVSLINRYDNLLVIQTMSKSRSLAGMRIGFAIGNESLIEALIRMKDSFNSYPVDRLALVAAEAAIKDQTYFEKTTKKIIQTRTWFQKEMKKLGFNVLPSSTNFVFATHPNNNAEVLYESLRKRNILIRYFNTPPIDQYVRITIGTDEEMKRLIKTIKELIK